MPKLTATQVKLLLIKCAHLLAAVAVLFFLFIRFTPEDDISTTSSEQSTEYITPPRPSDVHRGDFLISNKISDLISSGNIFLAEEPAEDIPDEITIATEQGTSVEVKNDQEIALIYEELYEETLPDDIIDENTVLEQPDNEHSFPEYIPSTPLIAIIIDDMGINRKRTAEISALPYPLTSSFLSYAPNLDSQIDHSLASGHEIMLHAPMEALGNVDSGPDVLTTEMSEDEIKNNLQIMLAKVKNIKGINNHMGSKLTQNRPLMLAIMEILKEKGLYFLDSKTSAQSIADQVAEEIGIPHATRNVFLDNNNDKKYILGQLQLTEQIARKNGYAIAIGHPKSQTVEALKEWLPTLPANGFKLAHLSEIITILNYQEN